MAKIKEKIWDIQCPKEYRPVLNAINMSGIYQLSKDYFDQFCDNDNDSDWYVCKYMDNNCGYFLPVWNSEDKKVCMVDVYGVPEPCRPCKGDTLLKDHGWNVFDIIDMENYALYYYCHIYPFKDHTNIITEAQITNPNLMIIPIDSLEDLNKFDNQKIYNMNLLKAVSYMDYMTYDKQYRVGSIDLYDRSACERFHFSALPYLVYNYSSPNPLKNLFETLVKVDASTRSPHGPYLHDLEAASILYKKIIEDPNIKLSDVQEYLYKLITFRAELMEKLNGEYSREMVKFNDKLSKMERFKNFDYPLITLEDWNE